MGKSAPRKRIDSLLLERGMVESRAKAQALVMAGRVLVDDQPLIKPGSLIPLNAPIRITEPPPFVSRGGLKLDFALHEFSTDPSGYVAADIGASTGGFTDCLLQHGASCVYAIDVGTGQLDYRLRRDPRVVVMEGVNARFPISLPEKVNLVTIDVSFISLEKVIPPVSALLAEEGAMIVLFKPQFEARKGEVGKGGVIRDPLLRATLVGRFIKWLTGHNLRLKGLVASPVLGAEGNQEFLMLLQLT